MTGPVGWQLDFYFGLMHSAGMRYDLKPVHRKLIVPWYDTQTFCIVIILVMSLVLLFSIVGLWVAAIHPENRPHIWIPLALFGLSLAVIVSSVMRLVKRLRYRYSDELYF